MLGLFEYDMMYDGIMITNPLDLLRVTVQS